MADCKTRCDLCFLEFNTTTALLKHRETKHSGAQMITFLPFYNGQDMIQLPESTRKGRRSENYRQWLGGIAESINSCLHPTAMGKKKAPNIAIKIQNRLMQAKLVNDTLYCICHVMILSCVTVQFCHILLEHSKNN